MSKNKYVWLRFRTKHSSGPGYWQYEEFVLGADEDPEDENILKRLLHEVHDNHCTHSEHWRGVEGDIVPCPPQSVLRLRRGEDMNAIDRLHAAVSRASDLIQVASNEYIPVVRLHGMKTFVPDPDRAESHERHNGYTFERENALRFSSKEEAEKVSPNNEAELF